METRDFVVRFAGEGGQGVVTAAAALAQAAAQVGYHVLTFSTFPSQIRGGPTWTQVRVATSPILSSGDALNVLVAFNRRIGYDSAGTRLRRPRMSRGRGQTADASLKQLPIVINERYGRPCILLTLFDRNPVPGIFGEQVKPFLPSALVEETGFVDKIIFDPVQSDIGHRRHSGHVAQPGVIHVANIDLTG